MRYPYYLRYLHEKALPRNPLWYPGNPRHRIFLPLYWLRVVENRKPMPNTFVKFECHWQMSAPDIKQYLEKLYNVSVLDINIEIVRGKYIAHPKKHAALSPPMEDRKYEQTNPKTRSTLYMHSILIYYLNRWVWW